MSWKLHGDEKLQFICLRVTFLRNSSKKYVCPEGCFLTLLLLTPDISGATYLACVTNTGYIRSFGTLALSKIKTP